VWLRAIIAEKRDKQLEPSAKHAILLSLGPLRARFGLGEDANASIVQRVRIGTKFEENPDY
jgi:hypothetical protein